MRTFTHTVAGEEVSVYFPERRADLAGFDEFLSRGDRILSIDTETTGLEIYGADFELRLFQIGNAHEAWVLRADMFRDAIIRTLRSPRTFVAHNAPFDLQVVDRTLGVKIEELADRVFDTRIFAHLLDPRQPEEGGAGLGLKPLSAIYVDDAAPDTQAGLHAVFRSITDPATGKPCTKETGWRHIPIDHPTYVLYAGLDVILDTRLFYELAPLVKDLELSHLSKFEHHLAALLAIMQRKGMKLDVDYIDQLEQDLSLEAAEQRQRAARYGVENVNAPAQVAAALAGMGEELVEHTPSGAVKVDKGVLLPLADLDMQWERIEARDPNPLADAVLRAKRAEKWNGSYVQAFRDLRDPDDRLHPMIGGLQARTGRMSISRPPLQQLPSGDWRIRRAFVADPGQVILSADYAAVELRVLAALADVKAMKQAIADGTDLHAFTAELMYGPDFTPWHRKLAKSVAFGRVYGGGASTLARQTGTTLEQAKHASSEYDRVYPEVRRYSKRLQQRAEYGRREVISVSGRHLPLDRDRLYAATNYVVQSTSRDVLAQAIVDVFDAGLGDHLLLPIHDELLFQAPAADAEEVGREVGALMSGDFFGVPLVAEADVYGTSWGHGYGAPV